jgi:replicative DNA helicase
MSLKVLRSLVKVSSKETEQELLENLRFFIAQNYSFRHEVESVIGKIIRGFFMEQAAAPSLETVRDELRQHYPDDDERVVEFPDMLAEQKFFAGADFRALVRRDALDDDKARFMRALNQAGNSLSTKVVKDERGRDLVVDDGRELLRLVQDGLLKELFTLSNQQTTGAQTSGIITEDEEGFLDDVQERRDKAGQVGHLFGYEVIDKAMRGAKPSELILVAAYTGEGKTTLVKNIVYNQVVQFGHNWLYITMETVYTDMRLSFFAMHSADEKWGREPLDTSFLRDGFIDDYEMEFSREVAADFCDRTKHGILDCFQPTDKITLDDIKMYAEMKNKQYPLDGVVIDYMNLLDHRRDTLPELIKATKQFATTFDRGRGIPIITPYQLRREGKSEFDEKMLKGKDAEYSLTHLAESAESERSADRVIFLASPKKFKEQGLMQVQDGKVRSGESFPTHFLQVHPRSERILNSSVTMQAMDEQDQATESAVEDALKGMNL